jgi:serine/threonine protein kinase
MVLFPKFTKAAGVTFGHRQKSITALARRGMLSEVMMEKVPFDYAKVGVDTGLNYAIKISAQGRKRIHDIGWIPKSILETGYGEKLPFGVFSKSNVLYRGGRFDRFGLRMGLPEEGMFKGIESGVEHLGHWMGTGTALLSNIIKENTRVLKAGGTALGIGAGVGLLYHFIKDNPDEQIFKSQQKGSDRGIFDQLSRYHHSDITGFSERGIGPGQRKEITDFGSGWDPARKIAKLAKQGLSELFESKGFQTALSRGTKIETLSAQQTGGALGVDLYKTTYKNQVLQYIKKRIPHDLKTFAVPYRDAPSFATVQAGAQGEIDIGKRFLQLPKKHDIAPSIYGFRKKGKYIKEIYQEYIPGITTRQLFDTHDILAVRASNAQLAKGGSEYLIKAAAQSKLPIKTHGDISNLLQKLKGQIEYLHSKGIAHTDLHTGNVMLTPKGSGFAVIDWALANRFTRTEITRNRVVPDIGWAKNVKMDEESMKRMVGHFSVRMGQESKALKDILPVLSSTHKNEAIFNKAYASTARQEDKLRDLVNRIKAGAKPRQRVTPTISVDTGSEISGLKVSKVAPKVSDWESPWKGPIVSGRTSDAMVQPSDLRDMNNIYGPKLGDIPLSVSSTASSYMDELNVPIGFQPGGLSDGSRNMNLINSQAISGRMSRGATPTMIGITGTPSPNLPNLNDNLPEHMRPMAPEQLGQTQMKAYLQDNVPLSTKIKIRGRVNDPLNLNELSQAVSSNIPKSKVNIYVNDNRSKLTEQHISDIIEK